MEAHIKIQSEGSDFWTGRNRNEPGFCICQLRFSVAVSQRIFRGLCHAGVGGSGSFLMVCCGKGGHHFHVTHFGILTKTDGVILIYFGFNSLCAAMC